MSIYDDNLRPLKLDDVKTYPLASRPSKVSLDDFANPIQPDSSLEDFLAGLPNILAVQSLREIAARMRRARELQKPIIWGIRRPRDQNRPGAAGHRSNEARIRYGDRRQRFGAGFTTQRLLWWVQHLKTSTQR